MKIKATTAATAFAFCLLGGAAFAQTTIVTIIGGSTGNGDFEAVTTAGDALPYSSVPSWINSNEPSDPNFSVTAGMAGHPMNNPDTGGTAGSNLRGGFLFKDRISGNTTPYTLKSGDTFQVTFDISRQGGAALWEGDIRVEAVLFTTTATVDDAYNSTEDASYEVLGTYQYSILAEPFWQTGIASGPFFTASAADAGKTVYAGFTLRTPGDGSPFPRLDNLVLQVATSVVVEPKEWYGYPPRRG